MYMDQEVIECIGSSHIGPVQRFLSITNIVPTSFVINNFKLYL